MPLYEYKCHQCGRTFEVIQKFADEPLTTHEGCGGVVERLLSAPAFQFKGTGWYVTDYGRKNGEPGKNSADSGKKSDSANSDSGGSASSSESKPSSGESKNTEAKPSGKSSPDSK